MEYVNLNYVNLKLTLKPSQRTHHRRTASLQKTKDMEQRQNRNCKSLKNWREKNKKKSIYLYAVEYEWKMLW